MTIPNIVPLPRGPNGEVIENTYRNIQSGNGTVTTAGTPVQLSATSTEMKSVDIYNNNSAAVLYIGGTLVSHSAPKGIPLQPGFTYRLQATDLSNIWIDSDTNSSTFTFTWQW